MVLNLWSITITGRWYFFSCNLYSPDAKITNLWSPSSTVYDHTL